jgi:pimeloyl-ACP methyl ester carboxylesterase
VWRWVGGGLFLILLLGLLAAWFRTGIEAALVLADMGAGSRDSLYKHLTEPPRRFALHYAMDGRGYDAELYHPGGSVRAGIVLVPGVQPEGKDEPRLVALATTLARARFAVLVPEIPGMRQLTVHASDVQGIADGCRWLLAHPGMVPDGRLGIGAVSYAVAPAVLAAMQPDIRSRVHFLLGVGGYYDLAGLLTYFTTGFYQVDGQWRHMQPNRYGMWVFALSNLALLDDPGDRQRFTKMARRKLADPDANVADLAAGLGPGGRALYALLTNTDRKRVPARIAALPPAMRRLIDALTLAGKPMDQLQARLILVHGRTDDIIPYTQSEALAHAVPAGQAQLFLLDGFGHADMRGLSLKDRYRLWQAVDALLTERN